MKNQYTYFWGNPCRLGRETCRHWQGEFWVISRDILQLNASGVKGRKRAMLQFG